MSVSLAELVARLQADVPARSGAPSAAQYAQAVEDAVEDYGQRRPMQKTADVAVTRGVALYPLPTDFVKLVLSQFRGADPVKGGWLVQPDKGISQIPVTSRLMQSIHEDDACI